MSVAKRALVVLIAIAIAAGSIQGQAYGDWTLSTDDETMLFAVTKNASNRLLGQFCYPEEQSCLWLIGLSTSCEQDHNYPVLVNSDAGSAALEVICAGRITGTDLYRYVFTNFDRIDSLVRDSDRIGFALPLAEDEFGVFRFNVRGATRAISVMREAADKRPKTTPRSTRDRKL